MRILSWNIAFLPQKINILRNPNKVLFNIIDKMLKKEADIINLQELFDYNLQTQIDNILKFNNYNTFYSEKDGFISKNGLLTCTNQKITNTKELNFCNYTGPEILINKGVISVETDNFIIHNTHLQSDSLTDIGINYCDKFREKQFEEINIYLKEFDNDKLNILCGDLNEDLNNLNLKKFIDNNPNDKFKLNKNKIITFPETKKQLDYILLNKPINIRYSIDKNDLSDHYLLICDLYNKMNNKEVNNIISDH